MNVRHRGLGAPLVLLATYALLTLAAFWISDDYVAAWLPLLKLESRWLLPQGVLCDSVALVTRNAQRLVELHATTAARLVSEHNVVPQGVLRSSTLQAYVLSHPVIVYAILAAWPVTDWSRRAKLLTLGVPCVLVTTSLDRAAGDPLAIYYSFMHGGGRIGLAISAALLTALLATRASRRGARTSSIASTRRNVNSSAQKRHRVAATSR